MDILATDLNNYVGIPFEWGGYTREGASCWGLVCLVQREVFGRDLPKLPHADPKHYCSKGDSVLGWAMGAFAPRKIDLVDARLGDLLYMRDPYSQAHRMRPHIGVFVDSKHILHTGESTGSIIQRIGDGGAACFGGMKWRAMQAYRLSEA